MAVWTHVANCLRCGAPIYSVGQSEGDDPPKTRYSCHCWDEKKPVSNGWDWTLTREPDRVDKS